MYANDSFFTLSNAGQIGLVMVSLLLSAFFLWLSVMIATRVGRPVSVLASVVLFFLFVWLTPQAYYAYYYFVFDDLPLQWVLKNPPGPGDLGSLLTFSGPSNMSTHSQGALGWLLLLLPQIVSWKSRTP